MRAKLLIGTGADRVVGNAALLARSWRGLGLLEDAIRSPAHAVCVEVGLVGTIGERRFGASRAAEPFPPVDLEFLERTLAPIAVVKRFGIFPLALRPRWPLGSHVMEYGSKQQIGLTVRTAPGMAVHAQRNAQTMSCSPFVFKGRQPPILDFVHDLSDDMFPSLAADDAFFVSVRISQTNIPGIEKLREVDHGNHPNIASTRPAVTGAVDMGGSVFTPSGASACGFIRHSKYVWSIARRIMTCRDSIGHCMSCP